MPRRLLNINKCLRKQNSANTKKGAGLDFCNITVSTGYGTHGIKCVSYASKQLHMCLWSTDIFILCHFRLKRCS